MNIIIYIYLFKTVPFIDEENRHSQVVYNETINPQDSNPPEALKMDLGYSTEYQ